MPEVMVTVELVLLVPSDHVLVDGVHSYTEAASELTARVACTTISLCRIRVVANDSNTDVHTEEPAIEVVLPTQS